MTQINQMTEQDSNECPFCGEVFTGVYHPSNSICPVSMASFTRVKWALRPPKKEAPQGKAILSEVEWLRQMVAALTIEPEPQHYAVTHPANIAQPETFYAIREGTEK